MLKRSQSVCLAVVLLTLQGCGLPPAPDAVLPTESLPARFPVAEEQALDETPRDSTRRWAREWWSGFEDPTLDRLLDSVLVANLDLTEAVARIEEARARVGIATADLFPQLSGAVDASRTSTPNNTGFGRQIGELLGGAAGDSTPADSAAAPDRFVNTAWSASLSLSYELDFWGRIRNDRRAAVADLLASGEDLQTLRLGILSEAITAWFDLLDLTRRITVTAEIVDVLEERTTLAESRYSQGLTSSFELYQLRGELRNAQTGLPQLRAQEADARRRLALLLARFPGEVEALLGELGTEVAPVEMTPVPAGVPADLLEQRPDVRAAARRLEASRFRVGARRAELLPRITLNGTVGLQATEPDELFDLDQWFSNLAAGLTAPLFQGGRLRSNLSAAEAAYAQQVAAWTRTVVTAVGEVEATLRQHAEQRSRFGLVNDQLAEAESSLELQAERYEAGVGGYADYLDALRNALAVRSTLASARRDLALARLAVHRALGGSWVPPDAPALSDSPNFEDR